MGRALAQTDNNVYAALGQVLGMGVALAAEADDSNGLAVQHAEVAVGIVVFLDRHGSSLLLLFPVLFLYFDFYGKLSEPLRLASARQLP